MNLEKYYSTCDIYLPDFASFRRFNFRLFGGKYVEIKDRIDSPETLRKWLLRYLPKDVYVSTTAYLNPVMVRSKNKKIPRNKWADRLFLFQDLVFDFDGAYDKVLPELIKAHNVLVSEFGFRTFLFVKSGGGLHLWVLDFKANMDCIPNPHLREFHYRNAKNLILQAMKAHNVVCDYAVTKDMHRVIRLPQTIHGKTMQVVEEFYSPHELMDGLDSSLTPLLHQFIAESEQIREEVADSPVTTGSSAMIRVAVNGRGTESKASGERLALSCEDIPHPSPTNVSTGGLI